MEVSMTCRRWVGGLALCLGVGLGTTPLTRAASPQPQPAAFDVNDISFLWPAPQTAADVAALISADEKTAGGDPIWPKAAFDGVMAAMKTVSIQGDIAGEAKITTTAVPGFDNPATWKVAGVRVDPSAPGGHASLTGVFGSMPQLRLVLQPVTVSNGDAEAHDFTVHLVYHLALPPIVRPFKPDKVRFGELVLRLRKLRDLAGAPTAGPLSVHPALKARNAAFAKELRAIIGDFVAPSRLFAVSFMGVQSSEPWIFVAMVAKPDGTLALAPQPALGGQPAQMLTSRFNRQKPRIRPAPVASNVDAAAGRGVSTVMIFGPGVKVADRAFADRADLLKSDIPDLIANPERAHFFNTDCVSCHTESRRRLELDLGTHVSAMRFALPGGVSGVDPAVLPQDGWNVRNFGWFALPFDKAAPTVTMRAGNEAAESAEFINREYLKPGTASASPPPPPPVAAAPAGSSNGGHATAPAQPAAASAGVANPLTLVMDIKSPQDFQALRQLLTKMQSAPPEKNPITVALTNLQNVHFARFVFLSERQLAVITTYDGSFDRYINAFVDNIGPVFDQLLAHMQDWPATGPVSARREEFLAYVRKRDLGAVGTLYSAYPNLTVLDILQLQKQQ
jgi:hypothetical protein